MRLAPLFAFASLAACSSHKSSPDAPLSNVPTAVVVAGDFTPGHPGVLATVDIETQKVTTGVAPQGAVGDDPELRLFGSDLYVINRADGDNITILGAVSLSLVDQLATGASSNPQDVAVTSTHLYVPILGGSGVAVLTENSTSISVIDLSAGAISPGLPFCEANILVGTKLYVACEELDASNNDAATVPGNVFVIDTTTNTVSSSFSLMNEDPVGGFHLMPNGDLAIATANYMTEAGCIEQITTTGTPASAGCLVTNQSLGGTVNRFEVQEIAGSDTLLWISVASSMFTTQTLYSYDLTTSKLSAAISPSSEAIGDLAVCPDGTIVVTDQTMSASGVRLYKNGKEVTTAALPVGLDTDSTYALVCY
jgi:WD40 repeat protein